MTPPEHRVEVRSGALAAADLEALHALAASRSSHLQGAVVPEDVVCLVRKGDGTIVGASTATPAYVQLVGSQRFGIYAGALAPEAEAEGDALLSATFTALDEAHDGAPYAPIGLCLLIADRDEMERRPEARWQDPPMYYVGYLDDGRQVRVAYFEGARVRELDGLG